MVPEFLWDVSATCAFLECRSLLGPAFLEALDFSWDVLATFGTFDTYGIGPHRRPRISFEFFAHEVRAIAIATATAATAAALALAAHNTQMV